MSSARAPRGGRPPTPGPAATATAAAKASSRRLQSFLSQMPSESSERTLLQRLNACFQLVQIPPEELDPESRSLYALRHILQQRHIGRRASGSGSSSPVLRHSDRRSVSPGPVSPGSQTLQPGDRGFAAAALRRTLQELLDAGGSGPGLLQTGAILGRWTPPPAPGHGGGDLGEGLPPGDPASDSGSESDTESGTFSQRLHTTAEAEVSFKRRSGSAMASTMSPPPPADIIRCPPRGWRPQLSSSAKSVTFLVRRRNFTERALGVNRLAIPGPVISPLSRKILPAYILRDRLDGPGSRVPPKLALLREVQQFFHGPSRLRGTLDFGAANPLLLGLHVTGAGGPDAEFHPVPLQTLDYMHFREEHLKQVNALLAACFWPGIDMSDALDYPDHTVVIVYGRLVVACAFLSPPPPGSPPTTPMYLAFLCVHPEWRRAGLAKRMLALLLLGAPPGRDVTLHVSPENPAMLLYQGMGFKCDQFVFGFFHAVAKTLAGTVLDSEPGVVSWDGISGGFRADASASRRNAFLMRLRR
ncbi:hypothetical protein H696_02609 [Fonticula alba]|uniref:N-acetyltransferase domain-containing protein n=1 Tax=Fonticula alba TaxID=691883 RepID=A0A058Z7J9_FONAL|nr:hypothetical protein H696_02609 [Fonticula alba]KCV70279.1 hypothetical protein H696_02609 [Fonticula alba]|eukprot:XP_009494795.1 hypothetical protein H696_02609 [Fonticula alba]